MKSKFSNNLIVACILTLLFFGCGSSTSTRFEKKDETTAPKTSNVIKEDFDFTPYKTKIEIPAKEKYINQETINAWYDYPQTRDTTFSDVVINTVDGYRVRAASTDNLDQADSLRTVLNSLLNNKRIYIIFDPPFYRIEIGDYTDISPARDLKFKLNQLGYFEARIINEKVNVYQ